MRSKAATGWGTALAILGALCLVAAGLLTWVVVPNRKELPADTNTTRNFDGTARVLLNPAAVATGDMRNALMANVPVTAERTFKVMATDGDVAQVSDGRLLSVEGQTVGGTEAAYAVDRKTLEAAPPAQGWMWSRTRGSPSAGRSAPAAGLHRLGARDADHHHRPLRAGGGEGRRQHLRLRGRGGGGADQGRAGAVRVAAGPAGERPQRALGGAAGARRGRRPQLAQALPNLQDPIPLTYTYESKSTIWVEPTTGIVVDTERQETRKAGIGGPGGRVLLAVPVYDVSTSFTDQSVTEAVDDANDAKSQIETLGTTLPWILGVVGLRAADRRHRADRDGRAQADQRYGWIDVPARPDAKRWIVLAVWPPAGCVNPGRVPMRNEGVPARRLVRPRSWVELIKLGCALDRGAAATEYEQGRAATDQRQAGRNEAAYAGTSQRKAAGRRSRPTGHWVGGVVGGVGRRARRWRWRGRGALQPEHLVLASRPERPRTGP